MRPYHVGVLGFALLLWTGPCWADRTIDHLDLAGVGALPQSTMDLIASQEWFFTHASVGANMVAGLNTLHNQNPKFYGLTTSSVAYDSVNQRAAAPGSITPGTVYECDRGNPGASAKFTILDNSVRIAGWHNSATPIVMDKLCYVDTSASAADYLASMSSLEASFPDTIFVYTTMPLTTGNDQDDVPRDQYNATVRTFCQTHDRYLLDIADIETCDLAGNRATFDAGGQSWDQLYSGYAADNGHLNAVGQTAAATGWYAMAALIATSAPEPSTILLLVPAALLLCRQPRNGHKALHR